MRLRLISHCLDMLLQALSYTSPRAIWNLAFPRPDVTMSIATSVNRVPAFVRYITNLEDRGTLFQPLPVPVAYALRCRRIHCRLDARLVADARKHTGHAISFGRGTN